MICSDYELIIQAYADELPFKAMELLYEMEREGFGWTHRPCSTVLQAFGKAGRLAVALQLINKMRERGINPNDADYLILIMACHRGKSGMLAGDRGGSQQALELLQLMQDRGPMPDGIKPNERNWAALLDAIGRAGQVTEMMAWYGEMCQTGEQPNVYTMTTLLDHAGAAGELSVAEGIWREMRNRQLEPDVYCYNALINCYATAKDPERRRKCLRRWSSLPPLSRMPSRSRGT
ncbi:hypothetical protein JKP88DRAFT_178249 [Tribonema minus]|uniref:Pentatricopeptide repeat-containing protein n=1 Tax=Tribonema minus TaxID=303371 RepID=A0A836CIT7_9STRA|nr:hypothetical protein JKP88DRAFT_178249 [Tribonema minus]